MGLPDIAGVFSRKFVVGFFIPVFFGALVWSLLVRKTLFPADYRSASVGTHVLIIGGFAVLVGLLLSGLHGSIIRLLEGYWLVAVDLSAAPERRRTAAGRWLRKMRNRTVGGVLSLRARLGNEMRARWVAKRDHLAALDELPMASRSRTDASRQLYERFPPEEQVLPTRFGNVIRAFETHPRRRYGLDGIAAWPRIASLLTEAERDELDEATTDLAFWVNVLVVVTVGGLALFVERLWHRPGGVVSTGLVELAVVLISGGLCAWSLRQATHASVRWGVPVRAAFDVHRLELYDKLGLVRPSTQREEEEVARAVGRLVAFAEPLPDDLRAPAPTQPTKGTE